MENHSKAAYTCHDVTTAISQISLVIYIFPESLNLQFTEPGYVKMPMTVTYAYMLCNQLVTA